MGLKRQRDTYNKLGATNRSMKTTTPTLPFPNRGLPQLQQMAALFATYGDTAIAKAIAVPDGDCNTPPSVLPCIQNKTLKIFHLCVF